MAFVITSECINCGECIIYCAELAIDVGGPFYTINSSKCNNCGICENYCPVNAIKEV
jgi:Pyruvate/2-oxoacid:ferredoxin oxidoreductase delta subunit